MLGTVVQYYHYIYMVSDHVRLGASLEAAGTGFISKKSCQSLKSSMAGALKKTTGLTGIAVSKFAHRELNIAYDKLLRILGSMPKESAYRKYTETLVKERQNIVQQNPTVAAVEEKIGCGQIEELLIQANNEISLAKDMLKWKPWENLMEEAPAHQWTWPPHK